MSVALQMNKRGSKYVSVVDAIIMQGRDTTVAKGAKTFARPYTMTFDLRPDFQGHVTRKFAFRTVSTPETCELRYFCW